MFSNAENRHKRYQRSRRWSNGTIIRSIGSPFTCCTHVTHMTHTWRMYVYTETLPSSHHHCGDEGLTVDSIHGSDSCLVHGRQKKRNKNIKQTFVVRLSWPSPHIIFTFVVRLSWPNPHIIVVSGREYPPVHSLKPPMHWDRRCDVASCA